MSGTFGGLEMGRSALNAFRLGMQTVGHNISNMNTEGYSRQRVNFATVTPEDMANTGQIGQGMYITSIERIRDEFLDFQFRDVQATLGYWEKVSDLYDTIQNYISEPNSSGIRDAMDVFFDNIKTVQQKPEDTAARKALVTAANSVGTMLDNLISNFDSYSDSMNLEIQRSVDEANKMLYDVAELNVRISMAENLGQSANDLRDQRDLLVDKLSKMMNISYNEPMVRNDIEGEFFLSVNGRVLVQGNKVRELAAHAFMWNGEVYYDVQVSDNEFNIVSNPEVADALATGPEGTYMLSVDRIANGVEWTTGGGNAHCLETYAVKTSDFADGIVLTEDSEDIPYKLQFRTLDEDENPTVLTIKIDRDDIGWKMRAEINGNAFTETTIGSSDLSVTQLANFIDSVSGSDVNLTVSTDGSYIMFGVDPEYESSLEVTDYSGMLGALTAATRELTDVDMRVSPTSVNDPLNISGSFRIQVGTQGTRVTSENFRAAPAQGLAEGEILGAGEAGEKYTFRVGVSADQVDFTATWNNSLNKWVLSSDLGTSLTVDTHEDNNGKGTLTVQDLSEFINYTLNNAANNSDSPALKNVSVTMGKATSSTEYTQFYIESKDNYLISISDITGDLAARMGIVNTNPVITIDVDTTDSLVTIRNKINEKYQEEFGLTQPEQWVHASVDEGYLTISANVAGEAQRITIMASEDGDMQVLRRLGLTQNQQIILDGLQDEDGNPLYSYREITYIPESGKAEDASFTLNNVRYLSSDNMFNMARRIPATTGTFSDRYSATELTEITEGMWLNLKSQGVTTINVRHHISDGTIKALEEIRDGFIQNLKSQLDEMAYGLIQNMNAYNYSGYGIASDVTTTGVAFFNTLGTKAGAATRLNVTERVESDPSLIAAAMGKKDENGKAVSGISGGSGDGTNASRMNGLNFAKVLEKGTMTIGGMYDALLSQIGTEAGTAKLMYTTESTVSTQIDSQRQACSGVNLDEELMDMIILNRAFGAMSRYITTYDEMLNTIINGFGLVGR